MKYLSPIEPLENRVAPATLVNPTTVTYHDLDGDDVTIKFSKPIFDSVDSANAVLKFNAGTVDDVAGNDTPQQLQLIVLTPGTLMVDTLAGIGVSVTAKRSATRGGDGFADVGFINAAGVDLGKILIGGDLGRIDAGIADALTVPAVQSLTVQSMGELGTSTQMGGGTLVSNLQGPLSALTIKGNLRDATIHTIGGMVGTIGTVTISGSIFGGVINSDGDVALVKVGGSLVGGDTPNTGALFGRSFGPVSIGGSVAGTASGGGVIVAQLGIGPVKIGVDLRGGAGISSGQVYAIGGNIPSVTVGGSVVGLGSSSGVITAGGIIGKITIGGDLRGGPDSISGYISSGAGLPSITIKGSLFGGAGERSAVINTNGDIGKVSIGKSVRGGSGDGSAAITSGGTITSITVGGSLEGYNGPMGLTNGINSAQFFAESILSVKIAGSIYGGRAAFSGSILAEVAGLGTVQVGGSVVGGGGDNSAAIVGDSIKSITIGGDVRGGGGVGSASLTTTEGGGMIGSILIGGSVYAGSAPATGFIGAYSGLPSVTIKGNLVGTAAMPAVISSNLNPLNASKESPTLGKINIGGRVEYALILAGYNGTLAGNADAWIGSVTVGGDWIASSIVAGVQGTDGNFGEPEDTLITALDAPEAHSKIGSVVIKGQARGTPASVSSTDHFGIVAESIGSIKIGGVTKKLNPAAVDAVPLGATGDFIAREDVAGGNVALPDLAPFGSTSITQVSPKVFTFTDVDGDLVTVKTTKAILKLADFITVASGAGLQLQEIRLANHVAPGNNGVGLSVTAKPQDLNDDGIPDGDGFINVGYVNAIGLDLGVVIIAGDLGRIDAGDANLVTGSAKSLTVQSLGAFGTTTQAAGGDLRSNLQGPVSAITVRGEALNAKLGISGTSGSFGLDTGNLKSLTVAGSWSGGIAFVTGKIGAVKIGRDLVGGQDNFSGRVQAVGEIGAVKIGGNIFGEGGFGSGRVESDVRIASVTVGGNLIGGSSSDSGVIDGGDALGAVTVKGSVIGGGGNNSANIDAPFGSGSIKSVKVGGDVRGGSGMQTSYIHAGVTMGTVTIGGSLVGGSGPGGAAIYAGSAIIEPHKMKSVVIGGDVVGGQEDYTASIGTANGALGGTLNLDISSITIKGGLYGGTGPLSAAITANNIAKLSIGLGVIGLGTQSAYLNSTGEVGKLTIGGSVEGASNASGYLSAQKLGSLSVKGDLRGGTGNLAGFLFANLGGAKSVQIGGSVVSGSVPNTGAIDINGPAGSMTIGGDALGTAANPVFIRARGLDGEIKPLALGKFTLKGSAVYLNLLAGYGALGSVALNADATVGSITAGGTWKGGSIVAGTNAGVDQKYGTLDDEVGTLNNHPDFIAKIGAITIKGRALGTPGGTDAFGFVSEHIASLKVGTVKFPLAKNGKNDNLNATDPLFVVSSTGDFRVKEVGVLIG